MSLDAQIDTDALAGLQSTFSGTLVGRSAADYDDIRRVHNGMIDKRPALIARCLGTPDVVDAVGFGVAEGLEVAVRGGGHNVAGRAVCDGGLMIDLGLMKGIWVDPRRRRARVQPGVCWGEFNRATQLHGLATTGGAVGSTGVAGLTLGGGFGYLMGKYGYTIDNLVSVELVTADGRVLTASEDENPDLFWGLRGGGGNFGVATSFEFALHRVGPTIHGGLIAFPIDKAPAALGFLRGIAGELGDEMTAVCSLSHAADGTGRKLVAMLVSHCGGAEAARPALDAVRGIAEPLIDRLGPISYCDLNRLLDAGFPKLALNYWKSCFVRELSDEVVGILTQQFARCPSDMSKLIIERPHGAALRRSPSEMAFPHRSAGFSILILSQWQDPRSTDANIAWARGTHDRLAGHAVDGAYSNYLGDDEALVRVRQAFGENFGRLQSLKDQYDPANVFHHNQNIPPSS